MTKDNTSKLGIWTSTSLVVGNMIGSGIFLMPAALAMFGSIGLLGWVFAGAGAILLAKVFSNLSHIMPVADGGPYAYTRGGLGDFAGFLVAWGYWISIWCTNAAIAIAFVSALSTFFPLLATNSLLSVLVGLGAIWLLTWVNTKGVVASGKLQLVTTILKIVPLVLVSVGGLFFLKFENFIPFNISEVSDFEAIMDTAALTFFAFLGIECATIPGQNVDNPEVTIPKATMYGTLLVTILYIFSTVSVMGMIPGEILRDSVTPFADAAVIIWGPSAAYWVSGGVAIAAFGALNGWILIQGQIPSAIAKDKLFPAVFAKSNKHGVPSTGIIIGSVLVSIAMAMNYTEGLVSQFKFLILLSTLTVLVPYLFSTASYVIMSFNQKYFNSKKLEIITLGCLAFLYSLWAVAGSGQEIVYWGFILMMAGIPFYVFILWKNNKE
ncbi:MAG: amino acid permease [Saprospiraceae bacterium]